MILKNGGVMWVTNIFKRKHMYSIDSNESLHLHKTLRLLIDFFRDRSLIDRRVINVKITTLYPNILAYISASDHVLKNSSTNKIAAKMGGDLYRTKTVMEFISYDNGDVISDNSLYTNTLLDMTLSMLEMYENLNGGNDEYENIHSTILYRYIINIVDMYRVIYYTYK